MRWTLRTNRSDWIWVLRFSIKQPAKKTPYEELKRAHVFGRVEVCDDGVNC